MKIDRNEYRLKIISDTTLQLKILPYCLEGLMIGITRYYNNAIKKEDQFYNTLRVQYNIGWEYFKRGKIYIIIKEKIDKWYDRKLETSTFTGTRWIKKMIALTLNIQLEELDHRFQMITNQNEDIFNDKKMSPDKKLF